MSVKFEKSQIAMIIADLYAYSRHAHALFIEQMASNVELCTTHNDTHSLFVVPNSYRVQQNVVSLCVYKDGDWLQLGRLRSRYDSINTLVMCFSTAAIPMLVGDHVVLIHLRYPVHSSQYYKQQSPHRV